VTAAWPPCLPTSPNPSQPRTHGIILPAYPARPTDRTTIRVVQFRAPSSLFLFSLALDYCKWYGITLREQLSSNCRDSGLRS